jgi:hypothetical protein
MAPQLLCQLRVNGRGTGRELAADEQRSSRELAIGYAGWDGDRDFPALVADVLSNQPMPRTSGLLVVGHLDKQHSAVGCAVVAELKLCPDQRRERGRRVL